MNGCHQVHAGFTDYLDGRLSGREMQEIDAHLQGCPECASEWESLRELQASLAASGRCPSRQTCPCAFASQSARRGRAAAASVFDAWGLAWKNTVGPFLLQASAGFASAVLLMGTVIVLVTVFAQPETAQATPDEPLGMPPAHACSISPVLRAAMRQAPFPALWSLKPTSTMKAKSTITALSPVPMMPRPARKWRTCSSSAALRRPASLVSRFAALQCSRSPEYRFADKSLPSPLRKGPAFQAGLSLFFSGKRAHALAWVRPFRSGERYSQSPCSRRRMRLHS